MPSRDNGLLLVHLKYVIRLKHISHTFLGFYGLYGIFRGCVNTLDHVSNPYVRSERHQRQSCELKELYAERNTYDGHAEHGTDRELRKSRLPAYQQDPENIAEHRSGAGCYHQLLTERHRTKTCELKALYAERDAYDRDAKEYS